MALEPTFALTPGELAAIQQKRHLIAVPESVFRFSGSGAATILQGLLTNDVSHLPSGSAMWGAFLTPRGMIITDAWIARHDDAFFVIIPGAMRTAMSEQWRRTVPPRLSQVSDESDNISVHWLAGNGPVGESPDLFRPVGPAPFAHLALLPRNSDRTAALANAGWTLAPAVYADVRRLMLGWPTVGREIDDRTLPQEVRFDELHGVRYDKGCYTGQETVARLHFRGHTNRQLRGVCWAPADVPTSAEVSDGAKVVGTLRTVGQFGDQAIALALLRREVGLGDTVRTGDTEGVVVEPPFDLGHAVA